MRCIGLFLLLMCTTAAAEDFCGFELHSSTEQAAKVVRASKSMVPLEHTRDGRSQDVAIRGGPLNGSRSVVLSFFDDQLYQVTVIVDPQKISVQQLAKLAERKYGKTLPLDPNGSVAYVQQHNGFNVSVVGNGGTTGIVIIDPVMTEACEKYKLDELGSL